jgi:hypothetical protein
MSELKDSNWDKLIRRSDVTYIICPDLKCDGFKEDTMRCTNKGYFDIPICPHKDDAYKILHCQNGHPNELSIDYGVWHRVDCKTNNCHNSNFNLMSGKYYRIDKSLVDEFLLKPFRGRNDER